MLLAALIFPSFLLSGALGQNFCYGGKLPCGSNAACDATTDECKCNAGLVGNPRISCVASSRCICTALADPVFGLFDPASSPTEVKVNLPCSVNLVESTTFGDCIIGNIIAHPQTRMAGNRAFVNQVEVNLLEPALSFTVDDSGTQPTTGVTTSNNNGFQKATVTDTRCASLSVAFNGTYGGTAIETAKPDPGAMGLCGDCDGTAESIGTTPADKLAYFLANIASSANQKGPHQTPCRSIATTVQIRCNTDAKRSSAAQVCERYLTQFGLCVQNSNQGEGTSITTYDQVLSRFNECIKNVCLGQIGTACTNINNLATSTGCQLPTPEPSACSTSG